MNIMSSMERPGCWVRPVCCGLMLMLSLWLQTAAGAVLDEVDIAGDVHTDDASLRPCLGEKCNNGNNNNNSNNIVIIKEDHALSRRLSPPRAKRQTVVVEVEDGRTHRVPCTQKEQQQTACLKGHCFALDMGQLRDAFCQCPAMYEGPRCELLSTYYFTNYYAQLRKGAIIGGVVVGIILLIVAASVYCSYRKGRRKRDRPLCCCCAARSTSDPKPETDSMVHDGEARDTSV